MTSAPPGLLQHLDDVLSVIRRPRMGLVLDFDGTISEIASTPDEATLFPGCAEALESLCRKLSLVAVVSGRSADDLKTKVRLDALVYVGNHGAEYVDGGKWTVAPGPEDYTRHFRTLVDQLKVTVDVSGLIWQKKGLSASGHFRLAADPDRARLLLAEALNSAPGRKDVGD